MSSIVYSLSRWHTHTFIKDRRAAASQTEWASFHKCCALHQCQSFMCSVLKQIIRFNWILTLLLPSFSEQHTLFAICNREEASQVSFTMAVRNDGDSHLDSCICSASDEATVGRQAFGSSSKWQPDCILNTRGCQFQVFTNPPSPLHSSKVHLWPQENLWWWRIRRSWRKSNNGKIVILKC